MQSYPIWNIVSGTEYAKQPSFGARSGYSQEIRVGTSARNSHEFAEFSVERLPQHNGTVKFRLLLNGRVIKTGLLDGQRFTAL